ncbi:MAG TPA: GNAT family N-acetyltransferase [Candidatus Nanopelagicales bacterium]|nr:GNAT family N-acetyltransferase [Candidatus Nanopelagicales bacterium]
MDEGDAELGERVADWYAEASRGRATTVEQLADAAWAMRTPEFPKSFSQNAILVRQDPGAEVLTGWADQILADADHRYVAALCDLDDGTRAGLKTAGYELTSLVLMARPLDEPPTLSDDAHVEAASDDDIARLHSVLWRTEWLPGIGDDEIAQLVDRRGDGAGELSWIVRDAALDDPLSGDLAACLDLHVHGWAAEIDAVATRQPARGRGYADALLATGVRAAYDAGCTHVVLSALTEDWPLHWYARRGFRIVGSSWEALKRLDGLSFASAS